ncbi:MAG: cobalt-precorrin-6A reductase [Pseudomonadota bacterium]
MKHVLLLAGTAEARCLAGRLWDMPGIALTGSLAGTTRDAHPVAVQTRHGGFGGAMGLAAYLRRNRVAALIDATHPFAAQMPWNAAEAAQAAGIPRLRLLRPAWPMRQGWLQVPDLAKAAQAIPAGGRVFLTTGRRFLEPFLARPDLRVVIRSIDPAGPLPPHCHAIQGRPSDSYAAEFAVMCAYGITHLVTKNSGGKPAKLDAAEALSAQVIVLPRPPQPDGPQVANVSEAVDWLHRTVGFGS